MSAQAKRVRLSVSAAEAYRRAKLVESAVFAMKNDYRKVIDELMKSRQVKTISSEYGLDAEADEVGKTLKRLGKKWRGFFDGFSEKWSRDTVRLMSKRIKSDFASAWKGSLTIKASDRTKQFARLSADNSAQLIVSIPQEFHRRVSSEMIRQMNDYTQTFSKMQERIHLMLTDEYKRHKNKAKNLALDQTRKIYNGISENRMRDVGMTRYIWRHAGGSKEPREYHKNVLNGQTFDLNDPPVIDQKTGERGNPSDTYNCKCYKEIVVDFG